MVVGGIKNNQELERFEALPSDVPVKDQIDLMSRCWFSLASHRTEPIEHSYTDARSKRVETVRITGTPDYGIATIHDQDLLIFVISHWIEAKRLGLNSSRRISFTPYQFFTWMGRTPQGSAYGRLRDALHRLRTTNIETTVHSESPRSRNKSRQFSWISEWEIVEEEGRIRGIEVVLAEWLFESIQDFHVLTLDKRYFEIPGSVERWLYLYGRKATGGTGMWKETIKSLYRKSASQQAYKHYASTLRKLVKKNSLPGFELELQTSATGLEMLLLKRVDVDGNALAANSKEAQLELIELPPLEAAWQNVLEHLRKQLGAPTVKSWLEKSRLISLEEQKLTLRAPTPFIAEWIESHYRSDLIAGWLAVGFVVDAIAVQCASD
jgi:plasmid replication initiation protein